MSGGRQLRSWAQKPKNRALMERIARAHFFHFSAFGLTYQSCRFCGTWAKENEDRDHGDCPLPGRFGNVCRGLWKYAVRHYVCSECRKNVVLGLAPRKPMEAT